MREWRFGGQGMSAVCKRGSRNPPDFGLFRELWTGRGSATSWQWSGTQARHLPHGNQRDGSSGQNIGWKRYVKDKWVNQEERTLDPECRDPAGHAQKGNNGSLYKAAERWQLDQSITKPSNLQDQLKYQVSQSSK